MWRHLENLPQFMRHVVCVTQQDEKISHWEACSPDGERIQWDARIIEEKPDELIAWESLPEADLKSAGSVRVSPGPDGGTVLKLALKYAPAGGPMKKLFARIFTKAVEKPIEEDLLRFKQLAEAGGTPRPSEPR